MKGTEEALNQSLQPTAGSPAVAKLYLKPMKSLWLILPFFVAGCSSTDPALTPGTYDYTRRQASLVNVADGVDQAEAELLASAYFDRYVSGCGTVGDPKDRGTEWQVIMYIGIAAKPHPEPLYVDKRTGRVRWSNGPTVSHPREFEKPLRKKEIRGEV